MYSVAISKAAKSFLLGNLDRLTRLSHSCITNRPYKFSFFSFCYVAIATVARSYFRESDVYMWLHC